MSKWRVPCEMKSFIVLVMVHYLHGQTWVMSQEYPSIAQCEKDVQKLYALHSPKLHKAFCRYEKKKPKFTWHKL